MKLAFRIWLYYLSIAAGVWLLVKFLPVQFSLSTVQLSKTDTSIVENIDTLEAILPSIPVDTAKQDSIILALSPKDSIITKDSIHTTNYLTAGSSFIAALQSLNQKLSEAKDRQQCVRILHLGDSQIEGDRITRYLRESFQEKYSGSGPGLTTVYDPSRINPSIWLKNDGDWQLRSVYDPRHHRSDNTYGIMGVVAELTKGQKGSIKISRSPWAESHAENYQKIRLFIAPHRDTLLINGSIKNESVITDTLAPSKDLTEINWEFAQISPSLKLNFESKDRVRILGCALDSIAGVAVDNIALRGQSTPLLHRTDGEVFQAMADQLNIGMIIFQFGTNMIPTVAPNYYFYEKILERQFQLIKKYLPNTPVLIIGIGDAAHVNDGKLVSYTHLKKIKDAQKKVALEHDFAFFDLYEAMGGEGSIIKWTNQTPPLALSDYIHLTTQGGEKVAQMLWAPLDSLLTPQKTLTDTLQQAKQLNDTIRWTK